MAEAFLRQLPKVEKDVLPKGSDCPICQEKYGTISPNTWSTEVALRLPCQHVVGSECIRLWLHPDEAVKNTCPYCRHEFFPLQSPLDKAQGADLSPEEYWDAYMITIGVTDEQLTVARSTLIARERQLYRRLRASIKDSPLPMLTRGDLRRGALSSSQEKALFEELERRKAFVGMFGGPGALPSSGQLWDLLRKDGFVFRPSRETVGFTSRKDGWYLGRGTGWVLRPWVDVIGEGENEVQTAMVEKCE
ncbi:hypothetical protein N7G274_010327 [Stereocaulon virgatum]|uniref:RING-type domain-containing protein n=1 Tax=Stereocaulon virgatum TaxID=373712 RepID=A0ABR3ZXU9_9LECA